MLCLQFVIFCLLGLVLGDTVKVSVDIALKSGGEGIGKAVLNYFQRIYALFNRSRKLLSGGIALCLVQIFLFKNGNLLVHQLNGDRLAVIRLLGRVCNTLLSVGDEVEHKVIVEILAKINVELANRHFGELLAGIGHIIAHCKEVRHFKVNSFLHDLRHFAELCSDIGVISGFLCLRSRSFYLFSKLGKSVGFFVYNIFMNRSLGIAAYLL